MAATEYADGAPDDDGIDGPPDATAAVVHERPRPVQRWASLDLGRVAVGLAVAAVGILLAAVATDTLAGMQADLARSAGRLPGAARSAAIGLTQLVAVAAPVALLLGVLGTRRFRMLGGIVVGAALAAGLTSLLSRTLIDDAQPAAWQAVMERESWISGRAFPTSAYIAGAVAAVTIVVRWVGPRWQRTLWTVVTAFAVVRIVSGTNLPLDLIVALGLGVAGGAAALLLVGSPDLSPSGTAVVAVLRRAGIAVALLEEGDREPGVTHAYRAVTPGGDLTVEVRSESDRDRDVAARAYTRLRTRTGAGAEVFVSVEQATERAAFVALWLDRLGLRVATPHAVAKVGADAALVARDLVRGDRLTEVGEAVDDAVLVEAWRAVARLHRGRVAHGALDADAFTVADDGRVWLRRLQGASLDASDALLNMDNATFLMATTLIVGEDRAVAACRQGLGDDGLRATLAYLQVPALPLGIRLRLRGAEKRVESLREAARVATGGEKVELVRLARVKASTLLALGLGVLALVVLLPQVTNLSDAARAMADADWPWLIPVFACAGLQYVASSVTFRAATPLRPPFGLTYLTQLAAATLNRVTPNAIGGLATNIRFLQRSGYDATAAATVMALVSLTGGVAGAVLIAVFVTWAGQSGAAFPWPSDSLLLVVAAAVLGLAGLVLLVPALRRFADDRLAPIARQVRSAVSELAADPRRAVAMFAGSVAGSLLQLTGLWFVLHAFGATIGIAVMGAVLFGGKALAGAAPTPGGVGAVEAALIGGLSGAGVDPAVATPAVLVFRLIVNWAVVIPGWWALHVLRSRDAL